MAKSRQRFTSRLSASELKEFRSEVSRLKKSGLIKKTVNARQARPYQLSNGKTLREIVNANTELGPSKFYVRDLPIERKSLSAVFNDIEKDPALAARINAMKKPSEKFAFEIDGTRSRQLFDDIQDVIDLAFKYGHFDGGVGGQPGPHGSKDVFHNRRKSIALYNSLKLVRWDKGKRAWRDYKPPKRKRNGRRKK